MLKVTGIVLLNIITERYVTNMTRIPVGVVIVVVLCRPTLCKFWGATQLIWMNRDITRSGRNKRDFHFLALQQQHRVLPHGGSFRSLRIFLSCASSNVVYIVHTSQYLQKVHFLERKLEIRTFPPLEGLQNTSFAFVVKSICD